MALRDPAEISSLSLEYVYVPVAAKVAGVAVDPSADAVALAFMVGRADPAPGDWKTASWDTDATTTPATYRARCLVGPAGAVQLVPGVYQVWVKINDSPEVPVKLAGPLKVT
jgi:hypothetical protein